MKLRLEHLPADVVGLSAEARAALAEGSLGGIPVVRRPAELARPADRHDRGTRASLADAIRAGVAALNVPDRVRTSLNVLANPGSFCVVTGQQPGFLCAPLYSLYKALQACRLADELAGSWGTPIVPVFWNHADDHDVAEVHHAYQLNRNLDLQKVGLAGVSSGRLPISRIPLDEDRHRLGPTRALLAQLFEEHPATRDALELFFPRAGETLARTFSRALSELLGHHGLVVVEPDWIRGALSRALADVIAADPVPRLARGGGTEPAIDPATAAIVYRIDDEGRRPLRAGGEGFRFDGEAGSRSPAELAAEIVAEPDAWSPAALLRPLVQDAVFPVCAYVGGWGELGYHAQLAALRDACGVPRTAFVPRVSATLVDPEVRVALSRTGASLREVLAARGAFDVVADEDAPRVIADLRADVEAAARQLLSRRADLASLEPALAVSLKRAVDQARDLVGKVAQKAERVHANKSGKGRRQVRRLNNTLYPRDLPQERVLGPLQYTARFGREWIEALYAEWPPAGGEHLAVHLEPDGAVEEAPGEEDHR